MKNIYAIFSVFIIACLIQPAVMAEQGKDYWNAPLRDSHGAMSKRRVVIDVSALPKPGQKQRVRTPAAAGSSPLGQIALTAPASVAVTEPAPQKPRRAGTAANKATKKSSKQATAAAGKAAKSVTTSRYAWEPQKSGSGPVTVIISLADQRAHIYRDGVRIGHSVVSTGRRGYETPTGEFTILQKKRHHVSNIYDAKMPYMQRLTWDGIALHGGPVPDRPASHGCIRFPHKFAKLLYGVTNFDSTRVVVTADSHLDGELLTSL